MRPFECNYVLDAEYIVVREIGRGAFGAVYHARCVQDGRDVAIKVLHPHLLSDNGKVGERFRRESALISGIRHYNIVEIYGVNPEHSSYIYAVYRLVRGDTLDSELRKSPLRIFTVFNIMQQILRALVFAHEKGVIHRDLKPANIMIEYGIESIRVTVLDFGLALVTDCTGGVTPGMSTQDAILGTPTYMCRDQILESSKVDFSVDIYAWGLIFLECLRGTPVVQGETFGEVLARQIDMRPVDIPENLPPCLRALLQKAVEKGKGLRYKSGSDLLLDLKLCEKRLLSAYTAPSNLVGWNLGGTRGLIRGLVFSVLAFIMLIGFCTFVFSTMF